MKLLMIIVDSQHREELEVLLRRNKVPGYTEIPGVHGVGGSGVRMGSRAHPKTSSMFFSVLPDAQVRQLRDDIEAGVDATLARFRQVSRYPNIVDGEIDGNPASLSAASAPVALRAKVGLRNVPTSRLPTMPGTGERTRSASSAAC